MTPWLPNRTWIILIYIGLLTTTTLVRFVWQILDLPTWSAALRNILVGTCFITSVCRNGYNKMVPVHPVDQIYCQRLLLHVHSYSILEACADEKFYSKMTPTLDLCRWFGNEKRKKVRNVSTGVLNDTFHCYLYLSTAWVYLIPSFLYEMVT